MLIFFLALIGLIFGGFYGLLGGVLLGYLLKAFVRALLVSGVENIQAQFRESLFALMGALSKADGVVAPEEIRIAEELFARFSLDEAQRDAAKAAFRRGKEPSFDLDGEVRRLRLVASQSPALFELLIDVLLRTAVADGEIHPTERKLLLRILAGLGLGERELLQLEAMLRAAGGAGSAGAGFERPASETQLRDAYTALGVQPEVSDQELKKAYRKMVVENHPDRVVAKGLPKEMVEVAERRTREINAAYQLILRARGK